MFRHPSLTRREALALGAAALGAAMTQSLTAADNDLPWIDAHSHIWPPDVDKFPLAPGQTKKDLNPPADLYNTSATKLHLAGVLLERAWNTLSTSS